MKRLHTERADRATEAAIEAGHQSRQSVSKARRKERESSRKRTGALDEDNGAFRGAGAATHFEALCSWPCCLRPLCSFLFFLWMRVPRVRLIAYRGRSPGC